MDKVATSFAFGFTQNSQTSVRVNDYVAIEDFITGVYEKFNSNSGWVNSNGHLFASAFSHYTWHKTNGRELVCDLQGVRKGDSYELTDPAIHSLNRLYGMTDLGQRGMDAFFDSHQCNELCYGLSLPAGHRRQAVLVARRNTSYTFELWN
ncbi:alpha-protein kinase vwkA-like [Corticium candelabrum]|uniref:alpha-protein kinase vwkA-like n=1 Tax=Corticium candelabrum TaxID=121492 RepID=UPI002E266627|nr:alpha-protein kinase vwkA-like [Corticium candelabrum]